MLDIPAAIRVTRSAKTEGRLLAKARAWIEAEERSPGLHASDLLDERMAYWSKTDPKPLPDRLVTMFLVGRVLHAFVIASVTGTTDLKVTDAGSTHSDELGIEYSPDLVLNGIVREVKTTRSFYEPKDPVRDLSFYLEQLLVYFAATNTTRGQLWILYLNLRDENGKTSPQFRCYTVEITEEDLAVVKGQVVEKRTRISAALEAHDPSSLPLCREFKCGSDNCEWFDQCRPEGRWNTKKFDKRPGSNRADKETVS